MSIIKQLSGLMCVSLFLFLSGCCSFPLVDYGPLITELQVRPKETTLNFRGVEYSFTFQAFNYYDRRSKDFIFTKINVHFNSNVEVLLEESGIYYFQNGKKFYPNDIRKINNEYYFISFSNRVFPNQIYFNGIIKVNQDEEKFDFVINIIDDIPNRK